MYNAPGAQIVGEVFCAFAVAGFIVNRLNAVARHLRDPKRNEKAGLRRQAGLHRLYGNDLMADRLERELKKLEAE